MWPRRGEDALSLLDANLNAFLSPVYGVVACGTGCRTGRAKSRLWTAPIFSEGHKHHHAPTRGVHPEPPSDLNRRRGPRATTGQPTIR